MGAGAGAVLLPGLLPWRLPPCHSPPEPSDQRPSRTSVPRRGQGGSAWSGLEGIRHPLAGFLLRLPATPCLPPYCFPVVFAPVKAHSGFHKTQQRKVLKCREARGNAPTYLPPSTPKISASPPVFSPYKHPPSITPAHTIVQLSTTSCSLQSAALKLSRAPPRKAGGKVWGVSEPAFAADTYLAVVGAARQRGGSRAGAFLLRYQATSAVVHTMPARGREGVLASDGFFPAVAALQGLAEQALCTRLCLACDEANVAKKLPMMTEALLHFLHWIMWPLAVV